MSDLLNKSLELSKEIDQLNKSLDQKIVRRDMLKKDIQTKLLEHGFKSFSELSTTLDMVTKKVETLYEEGTKYLESMSEKLSKLDKDII